MAKTAAAKRAAVDYANALNNFLEKVGYGRIAEVWDADKCAEKGYNGQAGVVCETGTFQLYGREIETDFGYADLASYGLKVPGEKDVLAEPYSAWLMLFFDDAGARPWGDYPAKPMTVDPA